MLRTERGCERQAGEAGQRENHLQTGNRGRETEEKRKNRKRRGEERTGTGEGKKRPGSRAAVRPVPPGRHKSPSLRMDGSVIRSADHEGRDEWARAAADRRQ